MKAAPHSPAGTHELIRRSRRRHAQRGAAVFIVVMAIVLLTGIGVFAVRSASLVDVAAGYDRQAMQTHHLSALAARMAAVYTSGDRGTYWNSAMKARTNAPENCVSNLNPVTGARVQAVSCFRVQHVELDGRVNTAYSGRTLLTTPSASADGSFGPKLGNAASISSPLQGQVLLEFSDPYVRGEGVGTSGVLELAVTAHAQIRPGGTSDPAWCAPVTSSIGASVQLLRANIRVP